MRKPGWKSGLKNYTRTDKKHYNKVQEITDEDNQNQMNKQLFCYLILSIFLSIIFLTKVKTVLELCEIQKCPHCYGENMCLDIHQNKVALQYSSVSDLIYNILSVKNVFFAVYDDKKVVLKKLAHNSELHKFDLDSSEFVKELLVSSSDEPRSFSICDNRTLDMFLQLADFDNTQHLSTILQINAEPVLVKIFNADDYFPVPILFGFCGRMAIMENCGHPLNTVENYPWIDRSYVAYQILHAARNFTENHKHFRLYLTDISPDNIVVDEELKVTFVDLEHAILKMKEKNDISLLDLHYTKHVVDMYHYSTDELCGHSISDHNIYGVCMMLLSKFSLWPMMKGGLLHDPPEFVTRDHGKLLEYIEMCVDTDERTSRFEISERILHELEAILSRHSRMPNT